MLRIRDYVKAKSLSEAYELNQKKGNIILGGMLWLKLQDRTVGTAIDLSGLGLDRIEENEEAFKIGAMVSLRQLEQHKGFDQYTKGGAKEALRHIVGVQFRNCATVGGSIYGRFGFSDILTLFLAMDSYVELYQGGIIPMEQFAMDGAKGDILVNVIVKKRPMELAYQSQRNTKTDFPVLTCAVSRIQGDPWPKSGAEEGAASGTVVCVIGARPGRAVCVRDQKGILKGGVNEKTAEAFGTYIQDQITVGSNMRAGAEYRKLISRVLVKRALLAMETDSHKGPLDMEE